LKNCHKKLQELIQEVVLADIEDAIDTIYGDIAENKNASEENNTDLQELHEMREEFQGILQDIEDENLDQDECIELYEQITEMIQEDEE
jgi:hypothetical protein